jgi:hypothetical protein
LEWALDVVRALTPAAAEETHDEAREPAGDPWSELSTSLSGIGMGLRDFRLAVKTPRGSHRGSRPWSQIDGILYHQTAAPIDDAARCVGIPAHALVTPMAVGIAHPPTAYLYHAHAGNRRFIGLEIACRAAGIEGDARTFWRSPREMQGFTDSRGKQHPPRTYDELVSEPTDRQLAAAMIVTRYWMRIATLEGHPLTSYAFHRNTHSSRVSDPGSRIARHVSAQCSELGLAPITKLGSGTLTPEAWGGQPGVPYSRKVPAIG